MEMTMSMSTIMTRALTDKTARDSEVLTTAAGDEVAGNVLFYWA
jgi:hypothetical protein